MTRINVPNVFIAAFTADEWNHIMEALEEKNDVLHSKEWVTSLNILKCIEQMLRMCVVCNEWAEAGIDEFGRCRICRKREIDGSDKSA